MATSAVTKDTLRLQPFGEEYETNFNDGVLTSEVQVDVLWSTVTAQFIPVPGRIKNSNQQGS